MVNDKLPISEIFGPVIQGEGKNAGLPTVFVRVYGCNMIPKCKFCDTKYSWKGDHELRSVEEVSEEIKQYGMRDITLTGGEFMIFKESMFALQRLLPGRRFHLETNGTLYDDRLKDFYSVTVSPKKQALEQSVQTVRQLARLSNSTFKFVYESKDDLWWNDLMRRTEINPDKVYIMPEGADREIQIKRMPEVLEYCQSAGFKFSPRLHVIAYDRRRGV